MIESYLRFNLHGVLSVFSGFLCLGLGIMVLAKDRASKINQAFFLFTLNACIWIVFVGFMSLTKDSVDALKFVCFSYFFGVPFIPISTYVFCVRLRGQEENKTFIWIGYALATGVMVWMIPRYDIISIMLDLPWGRYSAWHNTFESRLHSAVFISTFYTYSISGFVHLYKGYRSATSNVQKIQFRNCLIGFLVAYTGSIDLLTANGFNVYAFGYLSLTGFTAILAYTIVRHQLLDIRVVLKKLSLILAIYVGLFLLLLPIGAPLLRHLLSRPDNNPVTTTFGVGIALGLIFSLGPLIYAYLIRHSFWLKSNLTAGLTHELKSPLGVIKSASDILIEDLSKSGTKEKRLLNYAEMIQKNAQRMEIFVKDLLNLAKIQEDSISLQRGDMHLGDCIRTVVDALKPLADQKGLSIAVDVEQDIHIHADGEKIEQVISSLLSNAIKFSESGTVRILVTRTPKEITCAVSDEGCGIEEKHSGKVFERFYQAKPGAKGSGIGLTIAKAWVEAHGGRIWVESEGLGKGTKVIFMLPA